MTDVDELERIAAELAVRVRDDHPDTVNSWLCDQLPNPDDWFRLCFVLACAVPDDRSWKALTVWTIVGLNRPATREVRELQPCGTHAAYVRHLAHGEEPCGDCADASREYEASRKRQQRGAA